MAKNIQRWTVPLWAVLTVAVLVLSGCSDEPEQKDAKNDSIPEQREAKSDCISMCGPKMCGPNGCGGVCGWCGYNDVCDEEIGQCVDCRPVMCPNMECGEVGSTVLACNCGICGSSQTCMESDDGTICVPCDEACQGIECGVVGECQCGSSCEDKECGRDTCAGYCGGCAATASMCHDWTCRKPCNTSSMSFSSMAFRINKLAVGRGGHPGEALDVDNDPHTCAPTNDCQLGLDNQLWGLATQLILLVDFDNCFAEKIESGENVVLLELLEPEGASGTWVVNVFTGQGLQAFDECDWDNEVCDFTVAPESFHPDTCEPLYGFTKAVSDGDSLRGSGANLSNLYDPNSVPEVKAGVISAHFVRASNDSVIGLDQGILCDAIPKRDLMGIVDFYSDSSFPLPLSKDLFKNMLDVGIVPDMDSNGDGELESASICLTFTAVPANIVPGQ